MTVSNVAAWLWGLAISIVFAHYLGWSLEAALFAVGLQGFALIGIAVVADWRDYRRYGKGLYS